MVEYAGVPRGPNLDYVGAYVGHSKGALQTVRLPRLMALVRLIYVGFLENVGPPIFIYFFIFLYIKKINTCEIKIFICKNSKY